MPPDKLREYWAALEKNGISLNFGTYFSEAQVRVAVLNHEARQPSGEELAKMKAILETAMQNGAMGMTTALIDPPSYATTDELIEMAKVAGKYGGIYASHMRGEGKELVQSVDELIEIAEKRRAARRSVSLRSSLQPRLG